MSEELPLEENQLVISVDTELPHKWNDKLGGDRALSRKKTPLSSHLDYFQVNAKDKQSFGRLLIKNASAFNQLKTKSTDNWITSRTLKSSRSLDINNFFVALKIGFL